MLTINRNGRIEMDIDHLLEPTPITMDDAVGRYSTLELNLFYHVISSPLCRYEQRFGKGRVPNSVLKMDARERFKSILKAGMINGNPKGYFVNKHKDALTASQLDSIKSVSFALCKREEMPRHFTARESEYAICFFHDFLDNSGVRPVSYLNGRNEREQQTLIFSAPHLAEVFSPKYDMRWENEWRVKGMLEFCPDDVAFVVAPDCDYKSMLDWLHSDDNDLEDYTLLPSSIFCDTLKYLEMVPKLDHSGWSQIRLYDELLMDFEEFLPLTKSDKAEMHRLADQYLTCMAEAELHDLYEHRFTSRFFEFLGDLDDAVKKSPLFSKHELMKKNASDHWRSNINFVKASYEKWFEIQHDRITAKWLPDEAV